MRIEQVGGENNSSEDIGLANKESWNIKLFFLELGTNWVDNGIGQCQIVNKASSL